jgi:hypothetical protein
MSRKSIVWLASYPKSGNTWTRIFLANYLLNRQTPMPINEVHRVGMGDAIARTYRMVARGPLDTADPAATLALRGRVLDAIVANGADVNLVKTHNMRDVAMGTELIPAPLTRAAVYIIRNPLDLVLSYARHYGGTLEETVERIARPDNAVAGDHNSVPQFLGSWSGHVRSWTKGARFPVLVLRYEDLHERPEETFARLVEHLGMPVDEERLARAIRFSSFEEVSRQESKASFVEKSPISERFFSVGRAGQWEEALPPDLAERIRRDHGAVMKQHGYLR